MIPAPRYVENPNDTQRLMRIYIIYRICLGLMLGVSHWSGLAQDIFGSRHPELFSNIAFLYIAVCIVSLIRFQAKLATPNRFNLLVLLIIDIIALVLMIYASGNFVGGLGYLLLIPMAIGSTFLPQRENIGLAAFGTLLVLAIGFVNVQDGSADNRTLFSAGVTGVLLFVTAIAFGLFSEKVQSSQLTTRKVTEQANYLQSLNEWVVETLQTGVVVVDSSLNIQLTNEAARELLQDDQLASLKDVSELNTLILQWQDDGVLPSPTTINIANKGNIHASFKPLKTDKRQSVIIFLEDLKQLKQQAQQLKLASLGRLTANIAHEIRNPLNTISHASQLLYESEFVKTDDKQLLDMVANNSHRIDNIIKSIITFSRSQFAQAQVININDWLHSYRDDFLRLYTAEINIFEEQDTFIVTIDATHLYQIINNIVTNGLRYSEALTGENRVSIYILKDEQSDYIHIDIVDFGKGVDDDNIDKIFEPFFTTEGSGSGLGLYLCKELSIANHSELSYLTNNPYNLSTFRLTVPAQNSDPTE